MKNWLVGDPQVEVVKVVESSINEKINFEPVVHKYFVEQNLIRSMEV